MQASRIKTLKSRAEQSKHLDCVATIVDEEDDGVLLVANHRRQILQEVLLTGRFRTFMQEQSVQILCRAHDCFGWPH